MILVWSSLKVSVQSISQIQRFQSQYLEFGFLPHFYVKALVIDFMANVSSLAFITLTFEVW